MNERDVETLQDPSVGLNIDWFYTELFKEHKCRTKSYIFTTNILYVPVLCLWPQVAITPHPLLFSAPGTEHFCSHSFATWQSCANITRPAPAEITRDLITRLPVADFSPLRFKRRENPLRGWGMESGSIKGLAFQLGKYVQRTAFRKTYSCSWRPPWSAACFAVIRSHLSHSLGPLIAEPLSNLTLIV